MENILITILLATVTGFVGYFVRLHVQEKSNSKAHFDSGVNTAIIQIYNNLKKTGKMTLKVDGNQIEVIDPKFKKKK